MKHLIRRLFGMRDDLSISFYVIDFIFRKILHQNSGVTWPIHHTSTVHCPQKVHFGKNVFPGDSPNVYINALNGVFIGDYTNIGPNVSIISANHDFINNDKHICTNSIKIGKFCWLGTHSIILQGVVLGDFTIVGAGAIVTKSFEEGYCVLAGNPAKSIRNLNKESCLAFSKSKE